MDILELKAECARCAEEEVRARQLKEQTEKILASIQTQLAEIKYKLKHGEYKFVVTIGKKDEGVGNEPQTI